MTITTTIIKNSYSGNGTQTVFPYTFKINTDADIQVLVRSSLGTETLKTLSTDYTVSGAGDAGGGNVTMIVAPATGETLVIRRSTTQTQELDLVENDPFSAETVEGAFDKSVSLVQEIQEEADRSIKLSRTNTMNSTEFTIGDTDRANKVFGFDASGELTVAQELGTFKGNWSSGTTFAVRDIIKDTSNNNVYICLTAHTSSGSQPISTNTDVAKWGLLVDAAAATTSATNAANSATAAAASAVDATNNGAAQVTLATAQVALATTQATNSANSATASATSETNSANSATASANSATSSASSATASANSATASAASASAAEATFDLFDDSYLGAKTSNPTVDNDGDALQDGALYFDTTNDVMKVYNLANTTWYQLTPTVSNQTNINTVAAISSDVTSVANISSDVTATANNNTNITTVAGQITPTNNVSTLAGVSSSISTLSPISSNITTVAGISGDVTSVANISTAVSNVNSNSANINIVASDLSGSNNIGTVSGSITNVNNVGGSIASVNSAAANLASINNFGEVYRIASSAPTTSLNSGDLYFNTSTNVLNVYGASGWQNAGSSVNGTSQRYNYTATNGQTTFTGSDNNSNTLAYDAQYIDVYLNGVKLLNGTDVTVTSGSSVVLASGATTGDVVDIVAYGTFSVASLNADNLDSGTVPSARISGAYTGITGLGTLSSLNVDASAGTGVIGITLDNGTVTTSKDSSSFRSQLSMYNTTGQVAKFDTASDDLFLRFADDFAFQSIAGSEYMRIDSSGNVLVGTTDALAGVTSSSGKGISLRNEGYIFASIPNDAPLTINRQTSDGNIAQFRKNGTNVGSIFSRSGVVSGIILDPRAGGNGLLGQTGSIIPVDETQTREDNATDLGNSTYRFKDLYLGGGLYVGGTGTANKLDDYEEGTWTPSVVGFTTSSSEGYYRKVGSQVTVWFKYTSTTNLSSSFAYDINGLPFTPTHYGGTFGLLKFVTTTLGRGLTVSLSSYETTKLRGNIFNHNGTTADASYDDSLTGMATFFIN